MSTNYILVNDENSLVYNFNEENDQYDTWTLPKLKLVSPHLYKIDDYIKYIPLMNYEKFLVKQIPSDDESFSYIYRKFIINRSFNKSFLSSKDIVTIDVIGDGSCFYHSIITALSLFKGPSIFDHEIMVSFRNSLYNYVKKLSTNQSKDFPEYKVITTNRSNVYNPYIYFLDENPESEDVSIDTILNICKDNICNLNKQGDITALTIPIQLKYNINLLYVYNINDLYQIGDIINFNPLLNTVVLLYNVYSPQSMYKKYYDAVVKLFQDQPPKDELYAKNYFTIIKQVFENELYANYILNNIILDPTIRTAILLAAEYRPKSIIQDCSSAGHFMVIGKERDIVVNTLFPPGDEFILLLIQEYDKQHGTNYYKDVVDILEIE